MDGVIYLIHFDRPHKHARHYLGWTSDLPARMEDHRKGHGSRLMAVIAEAGIPWQVVLLLRGTRSLERKLKGHSSSRYCPVCGGKAPKGLAVLSLD